MMLVSKMGLDSLAKFSLPHAIRINDFAYYPDLFLRRLPGFRYSTPGHQQFEAGRFRDLVNRNTLVSRPEPHLLAYGMKVHVNKDVDVLEPFQRARYQVFSSSRSANVRPP
jgi:hypothetical protein